MGEIKLCNSSTVALLVGQLKTFSCFSVFFDFLSIPLNGSRCDVCLLWPVEAGVAVSEGKVFLLIL